jgi:hypothetical protein
MEPCWPEPCLNSHDWCNDTKVSATQPNTRQTQHLSAEEDYAHGWHRRVLIRHSNCWLPDPERQVYCWKLME